MNEYLNNERECYKPINFQIGIACFWENAPDAVNVSEAVSLLTLVFDWLVVGVLGVAGEFPHSCLELSRGFPSNFPSLWNVWLPAKVGGDES